MKTDFTGYGNCYYGYEIEDDETNGACRMYGRDESVYNTLHGKI
jgi:hypothetical protein